MADDDVAVTDMNNNRLQVIEAVALATRKRLDDRSVTWTVDDEMVRAFVANYLQRVDLGSPSAWTRRDFAALVATHIELGFTRNPDDVLISAITPQPARDEWSANGATIITVVLDDQPYIVDTLTLTVEQQGWRIDHIIHPQMRLTRDRRGRLGGPAAAQDRNAIAESWVVLAVRPPLGFSAGERIDNLVAAMAQGLDQLDAVADDDALMRAQVEKAISVLHGEEQEVIHAAEMLRWLIAGHFIFLGYREYTIDEGNAFSVVSGTGLGILRGDIVDDAAFDAVPVENMPDLMVITKDSVRSRIHRAAFRDYIGVRVLNEEGRAVGEHRFVGLFTASANGESVQRVPYLAAKVEKIIQLIGFETNSYGGQAVQQALEEYPREELFQASANELAPVIEAVSKLSLDAVRVFIRHGRWGRFVTVLVYVPGRRFTSGMPARVADAVLQMVGGESIGYRTDINETGIIQVYCTIQLRPNRPCAEIDVTRFEEIIDQVTRTWEDIFIELASGLASEERGVELGARYRDDYTPKEAIVDLVKLNSVAGPDDMSLLMYAPDERNGVDLRLKVYRVGATMLLSDAMPHLTSLGVRVVDERPYECELRGKQAMIYDFGLILPSGADVWDEAERQLFTDAFAASLTGRTEADELNRLVSESHLSWRQVSLLRAFSRYLQQLGVHYSQAYIAQTLTRNQPLVLKMLTLFKMRFDPQLFIGAEAARATAVDAIIDEIAVDLDAVPSLDDDRILRLIGNVILAIVRTNYYTQDFLDGGEALAIKLLPKKIDALPQPRPEFEIFVYSPRVEGVHLRFGKVARGGLRWSDRAEDYRTEILGLVKAQMVKNTVIIPVGAKGGFFPKRLTMAMGRTERAAEAVESYQVFIRALLSVTDNLKDGRVVVPENVVRADGDDPYLVVAADKGTATFSDTANEIAVSRGFWLGDAFASGGSQGYDHKKMGITARGAWESVKRHFAEMGVDCQTEDFTCVGIGDMGGDVFGNGMLLSKHIRLLAAFNHLHIFLDPNPDAALSWRERQRLFSLPRSTWADYDPALISEGGGVFERSAKSITITPQVREALGLDTHVSQLSPAELISAILAAPVDLLWNGGIGTYVKAQSETNEQVGDKANDSVRINAVHVRARCVGEGGNLGWTQRGRVEYALKGGRINTDFIDNSAGVDTSDREVNIKIMLNAQVDAGRLSVTERNELLLQMADDVAHLVLRDNVAQNTVLADEVCMASQDAGNHENIMSWLSAEGYLQRDIEYLPSTQEMQTRISEGKGLTSPELAVLLSYVKIILKDEILKTDLPEDPYLADRLIRYFPPLLRERFAENMTEHPLAREIITTVAVNRFVDSQGISAAHQLSDETGASIDDVFRAQLASRSIFNAGPFEVALRQSALSAEHQTMARLGIRKLVERGTRWLLHDARGQRLNVQNTIDSFKPGVQQILVDLPEILGKVQEHEELDGFLGMPTGRLARSHLLLPVVRVARQTGADLIFVARVFFALRTRIGTDLMLEGISMLPQTNRWEIKARAAMRDELYTVQEAAAVQAINYSNSKDVEMVIDEWLASRPQAQAQIDVVKEVAHARPDLAQVSVGLRMLRSLLG